MLNKFFFFFLILQVYVMPMNLGICFSRLIWT